MLAESVFGSCHGLALLVAKLVIANTSELSGGELLLTGFTIWAARWGRGPAGGSSPAGGPRVRLAQGTLAPRL